MLKQSARCVYIRIFTVIAYRRRIVRDCLTDDLSKFQYVRSLPRQTNNRNAPRRKFRRTKIAAIFSLILYYRAACSILRRYDIQCNGGCIHDRDRHRMCNVMTIPYESGRILIA